MNSVLRIAHGHLACWWSCQFFSTSTPRPATLQAIHSSTATPRTWPMPDPQPNRAVADRNLLFGILALQMDFIRRDALIAAMHAWVLEKAKPLGQILLDQGALAIADHELLEVMVRRH